MVQVKSFIALSPEELSEDINKFISQSNEDIEVLEIQYMTSLAPGTYGAYLTYHKLE